MEPSASALGQALEVAETAQLVGAPLRIGEDDGARSTSVGALLLVRDGPAPLADDECAFITDYASLAALALQSSQRNGTHVAAEAMLSFLNLVVHDLRAPLTVLSGYVDLLRAGTFGDGPQAWEKPLEMIAGKLSETHRLVDDILLAARLESGAVPVRIEDLDLNEVVARAAGRSEARAELAGARIESRGRPAPSGGVGGPVPGRPRDRQPDQQRHQLWRPVAVDQAVGRRLAATGGPRRGRRRRHQP